MERGLAKRTMSETESRSKRIWRSVLWIVVLLTVCGAIARGLYAARQTPPKREVATLLPLVETMTVQAQNVVEQFVGYGSAKVIHEAKIAAELFTTVVERVDDIRDGAVVTEGQVLFRLDSRQFRHASAQAEALAAAERASLDGLLVEEQGLARQVATAKQELRVARDERSRLTGLFEKELATKKEFDFSNLQYQQAQRIVQKYELQVSRLGPQRERYRATIRGYEEEAALARLNIDRCEIRAPFDAHVTSLHVDVGDYVGAGLVVATLVDPSRVEVAIHLPASIHDRVKPGANCRLTSESSTGSGWTGSIARVSATADAQTRTFAAYVVVDNSVQAQPLVPGVFVTATIEGPTHSDRILVPRRAVRGGRVFIIEGDHAKVCIVSVDRHIGDQAMVRGELKSGDRVILTRLDRLADGSPVRTRGKSSTRVQAATSANGKRGKRSP